VKVVTVVGARPQFIKCAPVSREIRKVATEVLIHTGQHYDAAMSDVFFEQMSIPRPNHNLGVGSGSHGWQTAKMLERIEAILLEERPDWCVVYGDTNSTLAGALAAAKLRIPVAHIEAGLRSFNRDMPEELNRITTDHLSDICFCPTSSAVNHLANEGIVKGVHLVGDVMFDAFRHNSQLASVQSTILDRLELVPKQFMLATVHRAENTDRRENLTAILDAFVQLAESGVTVVLPLHPRTANDLAGYEGLQRDNLRLIEPVNYLDMLSLERHASVIMTDSGGVQKEAYWSRVPCVTFRTETEWVETIDAGWNVLVGPNMSRIVHAARTAESPKDLIPGWEEHEASREIVATLVSALCQNSAKPSKVA